MISKTLIVAMAMVVLSEGMTVRQNGNRRNRNRGNTNDDDDEVTPTPDPEPTPEPVVVPDFADDYFFSTDYRRQDASAQLDDLWSIMVPDESADVPPQPLYFNHFDDIFTQDASLSFTETFDQLDDGRFKTAHTQGLHAKASWTSTGNHGFTGIFEEGTDNLLIRFSETTNLTSESGGLLPSLSIKAMIDRRPSSNIVAMPFFTSTNSWNFFENPFKTRVDPFDERENEYEFNTIRKKLVEGSGNPYVCGFGHFGDRTSDATFVDVDDVSIPYEL